MSKLADLVIDKKLKAREISVVLEELHQFNREVYAYYDARESG